jgi:hypothetical protein
MKWAISARISVDMRNRLVIGCAVAAGLSLAQPRLALAGWTGQMNGTGFGRASVNVTSATLATGSAATLTMPNPSAAMKPTGGYVAGAPLPSGSSPSTAALIKGLPGYVWQATTYATGGDKTDNQTIENLVTVTPQPFAFLDITTSIGDNPNGPGLALNILGTATGGTALLTRGFVWAGLTPPTDEELLDIDFVFSDLVVGEGVNDPTVSFRSTVVNRSIPFPTLTEEEKKHFYVIIDGLATSAVPDGGSLAITFALTVGGMAVVRRFKRTPVA